MRLRPGLCPGPRWGNLQRSPGPLAGFKGPTFKGRGRQGRRGKGRGRERKGAGGEKGKGRERVIPVIFSPLRALVIPIPKRKNANLANCNN